MALTDAEKKRVVDDYLRHVIGANFDEIYGLMMENYIMNGTVPTEVEMRAIYADLKRINEVMKI